MPRVSVIMSIYNCRDYSQLRKSVQSILDQTYTDWEFIIYNDGSSDLKLQNYINSFSKLDERIRVINSKVNKGLAYAKNKMIDLANGEYITAQDDDDISMPERLSKEVNFLDSHPDYAFVGTLAKVFDKDGIWGTYDLEEIPNKDSFLWNSPFLHPSVMFRRESLNLAHGYRVAKETKRAEDYDLFFRLYALELKGYNIQEYLYEYQINNNPHQKYRPMSDRIQESIVRYKGYKALKMRIKGIPFVIKPILIGLIPQKIFYFIRKKNYKNSMHS